MELKLALDEKQLDYRLRDRLLAEGKVSKEQVEKYFQSLPDDKKNCETLGQVNERLLAKFQQQ